MVGRRAICDSDNHTLFVDKVVGSDFLLWELGFFIILWEQEYVLHLYYM